jgi:accessory gene regulator protein AgrB
MLKIKTLFSYGAKPTHSLTIYLMSLVLFPSFPFLETGDSLFFDNLVVINPLFNPTANPFI